MKGIRALGAWRHLIGLAEDIPVGMRLLLPVCQKAIPSPLVPRVNLVR